MKTIRLLFNDAMARAIVEGRKTVTRRPVMPGPGQRWWLKNVAQITACPTARMLTEVCGAAFEHSGGGPFTCIDAPCAPGDLLIGRECWREDLFGFEYRASSPHPECSRWRPSIHMPDRAARIRRRVVSVTVERLQDITEEDAVREGFATSEELEEHFRNCAPPGSRMARPVDTFEIAWDAIYTARGLGWDVNPWVWRIEFGPENAAP